MCAAITSFTNYDFSFGTKLVAHKTENKVWSEEFCERIRIACLSSGSSSEWGSLWMFRWNIKIRCYFITSKPMSRAFILHSTSSCRVPSASARLSCRVIRIVLVATSATACACVRCSETLASFAVEQTSNGIVVAWCWCCCCCCRRRRCHTAFEYRICTALNGKSLKMQSQLCMRFHLIFNIANA